MSGAWRRTVLLTGASGGLGTALARELAGPGVALILQGRDAGRLAALARECEGRGARVETATLELREIGKVVAWAEGLAPRVDLAILAAGMTSNVRAGESWREVDELLQVNLRAPLALVGALVPAMRRRGAGQIALLASLNAWLGMALTPAYGASKAALKNYGEALRAQLAPYGIRVSVVLPGFVRTPMSERYPGPKPLLVEADRAARRILRGLERNEARIAFPWLLAAGMQLLSALPAPLAQWILRRLGFGH